MAKKLMKIKMNSICKQTEKLFIIGNGFDLAHNIPTKYNPNFKTIAEGIEQTSYIVRLCKAVRSVSLPVSIQAKYWLVLKSHKTVSMSIKISL